MAGGGALAQCISLLTIPITSRIFDPSEYGLAAVLSSIVGVLTILATFRLEMAVTLTGDDQEARAVVAGSVLLAFFNSLVVGLLAWSIGGAIFSKLGAPQLLRYWWTIPASVFGVAVYQIFYYWNLRNKAYLLLAETRVRQSVAGALTCIGVGLLWQGPLGLLLGGVVTNTCGIHQLGRGVLAQAFSGSIVVGVRRALQKILTYGRFAAFTAGAALLNLTGTILPPLLFSVYYGQEVVGSFSLAQRVVLFPMSMIGTAVAQVFTAEVSELIRQRTPGISGFFYSITRKMKMLALAVVLIGAASPLLFPIIFGTRWQTAGIFAAFLSVSCSAQLIVSPISSIALLLHRQDLQLLLDAFRACGVLCSILLPAHFGASALLVIGFYVLSMSVTYAMSYVVYKNLVLGCAGTALQTARQLGPVRPGNID